MDFRPLYRPDRHLFAIGYNLVHGRLDSTCYDLLASECCLTSYLAVARGEAPRRHWFQLGRPFIRAAGRIGLISWGGTMFEYLMPRLLLRSLPGTLLAEACRTAVARQIEYGRELGLPWGISESGFAAQYLDGDYQYQAFGVPGLGLKQGLEQDRVIAPYATAMATMLAPREALANFRRLTQEGAEGEYGFYEAIDYTPDRLPKGKRSVVVRSYMAHHQGMSLVALTNALLADVMTQRFQAEPMVRAIELLLQERVPTRRADRRDRRRPPTSPGSTVAPSADADGAGRRRGRTPMSRRLTTPSTPVPRTHLLSNTPVPRHAHQRRLGLEHLPGAGRDPLARGRRARGAGASSATSATSARAWSGRPATSRSAGPPSRTRSSSPPTRPPSAAATWRSRPCSR